MSPAASTDRGTVTHAALAQAPIEAQAYAASWQRAESKRSEHGLAQCAPQARFPLTPMTDTGMNMSMCYTDDVPQA